MRGVSISIKREMADLILMFVEIKVDLHYKTLLFKFLKPMKLITGHIFVSYTSDHHINITKFTLLYNRTATLSSKQR